MNHSPRTLEAVNTSGDTLSVRLYGSGPAVMLVHGFPLDGTLWDSQIAALTSTGHQVVVPELRGFGRSTLTSAAYTLSDLAEDLELVRQLALGDERLVLVGLSMGGYVAFEYWRRYAAKLNALVLCNTKPSIDNDAARAGRLAMAASVTQVGTWEAVQGMLPRLLSEGTREAKPDVVAQTQTMMQRVAPAAVAAAQRAMADRRDFTLELGRIDIPTLVITGEHDPIATPSDTERWAREIRAAEFQVIDQAGHLPPIETPEVFNQTLIRFLRQAQPRVAAQ